MQFEAKQISAVFGVQAKDTSLVHCLTPRHPESPEVDQDYAWTNDRVFMMRMFEMHPSYRAMCIKGHMGVGKSTLVEQWYAKRGMPLVQVTVDKDTDRAQLFGHDVLNQQGGMEFRPGPVILAAMNGWPILIDEYNVGQPDVMSGLNQLLLGKPQYIPEMRKTVTPHPAFRLYATINVDSGEGVYFGRKIQDGANDRRFMFVDLGSPPQEVEEGMLRKIFTGKIPDAHLQPVAAMLYEVASKIRKVFVGNSDENNAIEVTMDTATLMNWARTIPLCAGSEAMGVHPYHLALEFCLTNRPIQPSTKEFVHKVLEDSLGQPRNLQQP